MKILIVDDSPKVLLNLKIFILAYFPDAEVYLASNEHEALEAADFYKPDIFLIDYRLKEANGTVLISKLKKVNPQGHYAIISAFPRPERGPQEFERWFVKGTDLTEILSYIGRFQEPHF
jgi:DNA-binding NarL/FixJ family response regulator